MGQHRQQPLIGGKHHHLNNATQMKKFLIWSLGIVVPFLVLFCIFPSGTSSSYNRIVVSQLQVPASRVQSSLESKISSNDAHQHDKKPTSKTNDDDDDDDNDDGIDDDASDLTFKTVKKQSDDTMTTEKGFGVGESMPKATKMSKSNPKEKEAPSVIEVDHSSTSKAKKQAKTESSSADAGTHLLPAKGEKQSDDNVEEMQIDEKEEKKKHKEKKQSDEGNHVSTKAKRKNDGDEGDHLSTLKAKKQKDTEEPIDVLDINDGVDLSSKKAKKKIQSEPEINAFMIEKEAEEQNDEPKAESESKKTKNAEQNGELNADSETKKSTKKEKKVQKTEEMPKVELDEELSLSGKGEEEPHIADIEIKKSTKKVKKAMQETDEPELNIEDSSFKKRKADRYNEDIPTAKSSRGSKTDVLADEDEENISLLGKESSLDEDTTSFKFPTSKQSIRKTMGMNHYKDPAASLELDGAEEEVSFLGKRSKKDAANLELDDAEEKVPILGKRSKKDAANLAEEEVSALGKRRKKEMEDEDDDDDDDEDGFTKMGEKSKSFTKSGKVVDKSSRSPDSLFLEKADEEALLSQSTNGNKKKRMPSGNGFEEMEDADNTSREQSNLPVEDLFSSKKRKLKKVTNDIDDVEREDRPTKFKQKHEKDVEYYISSTSDDGTIYLEKADEEALTSSSTMKNKKKKKFSGLKKLKDVDLDDDLEQHSDETKYNHMDHSSRATSKDMPFDSKKSTLSEDDLEDVDRVVKEAPFLGKRKGFKKKIKDVDVESDYAIILEKGDEDVKSFKKSPYISLDTSSKEDGSEEFLTRISRKKKQTSSNEDSNGEGEQMSQDDDASNGDQMDHTSSVISKPLPLKKSMVSGKCRYFEGRWTMDSNYPPYKESTCIWKSIGDEQNCKAARKISNWRWKPSECNMERFKANAFLELMQGKSMAFVGDTMVKAQIKSLVCLLAKVETPRLLYNDKENQSMSWHFFSSNLTLSLIWSPYLVQQTSEQRYPVLRLDKLDTKWAEMVPRLDVLVLGVGTHFAQPNLYMVRDDVVGCYSCQGLSTNLDITKLKEISLYSGFRATMRSSIMGIGALPGFKGIVLFLQPFGFEGNGSYYGVSLKMKEIQEQELKKAHGRGSISNESKMEVLQTNFNSMGKYDPIKDLESPTCLIPTPLVDTWNQVLQHTLARVFTLESDT